MTKQFLGVTRRLKQEHCASLLAHSLQKKEEQCGFAHTRRRNQGHEPAVGLHAIDQRGPGLAMGLALVKEPRVRRHPEGVLSQVVVAQEHFYLSPSAGRDASTGAARN